MSWRIHKHITSANCQLHPTKSLVFQRGQVWELPAVRFDISGHYARNGLGPTLGMLQVTKLYVTVERLILRNCLFSPSHAQMHAGSWFQPNASAAKSSCHDMNTALKLLL